MAKRNKIVYGIVDGLKVFSIVKLVEKMNALKTIQIPECILRRQAKRLAKARMQAFI